MVISRRSKRSDSDSTFMRSGATSRSDNRAAPAVWTWFLAGLFAGLFIAFLIYLGIFATPSPATATVPPLSPPPVAKPETKVTETAPAPKTPTEATAPKFEFYDVLTQNSGKARQPAPLPTPPQTDVSPAATQSPAASVSTTGAYVLQLAAFKDAREADSFKAHVASLGFSAGIEVANVNGTAWHRVRMGFENAAQMNEIKAQLEQHNITAVAVKF